MIYNLYARPPTVNCKIYFFFTALCKLIGISNIFSECNVVPGGVLKFIGSVLSVLK